MDEIFDRMREHANKAKDEAAKLTRQVVDKTNCLITQTKLNFAVNETEGKIKEIYAQMGKKVYEKHLNGVDVYEELEESCMKIDDLMAEAADLREKLAEVRDSLKCPKCGEYNKKTSTYCSKCGSILKTETDGAEKDTEDQEETVEYAQVDVVRPHKPETEGEE